MEQYAVTFLPDHITVRITDGMILDAQIKAGLRPDAPCGGKGTCGKCRVQLDGKEVLACQTRVDRDMVVTTPQEYSVSILSEGISAGVQPDGTDKYVLAFDIGTTTVVAYLLDGITGELKASASCMNPQGQYGADVISRIEEVLRAGGGAMQSCIRRTLEELTVELSRKTGVLIEDMTATAIVGNTAMHHLLLGIDPKRLVFPPYMPRHKEAIEKNGTRILPNIAGFVGGDTVGCMVATRFDQLEDLTLLIDIGTNGEMVLGDKKRRIACSTAAGPAFEGAKISCGMRGADGAVDHVWLDKGTVQYRVIGEATPKGLCGSGLLDLVAVLLDLEIVDESGHLGKKTYTLCENVTLTQKDIREVQLAKAAIRTGIELLVKSLSIKTGEIQKVYLAGAFGNYMNPVSACRIGMIPPVLQERIVPIGNAAGEGAKLCALSRKEFEYSKQMAKETEFLELASLPEFQDTYVDALLFEEEV